MTPGSNPREIDARQAEKLLRSLARPTSNRRSHLTEEEIVGWVSERLNARELADCEAHIEACEQCCTAVAELSDAMESLTQTEASSPDIPASPLKATSSVVSMPGPRRPRIQLWAGIAAGISIGALALSAWLAQQLSKMESASVEYQRVLGQRDERIRSLEVAASKGASEALGKVVSFVLHRAAGTRSGSRSGGSLLRIASPVETVLFQFEDVPGRGTARYEFELRNTDRGVVFSVADVRPSPDGSGALLKVSVPANVLVPGDYTALLTAVSVTGTHTGNHDYAFKVAE